MQGKDSLSRTKRLEEFYIFQLEVVTVVNDDIFYFKTRGCKHCTFNCKSTSNRKIYGHQHVTGKIPIQFFEIAPFFLTCFGRDIFSKDS